MNNKLIEGEDYYWEIVDGIKFRVFTASYLLKRGFCCSNLCVNCPYSKGVNKKK